MQGRPGRPRSSAPGPGQRRIDRAERPFVGGGRTFVSAADPAGMRLEPIMGIQALTS